MTVHHTIAGVIFGVSILVFADGGITARTKYNKSYEFVDALGVLFSILGLILFTLVNIRAISSGGDDDDNLPMMGGGDPDGAFHNAMTARVLFFVSFFFMLTGFSLTIWRIVYWSNDSQQAPWVGWAQVIQSFMAMISAGLLCYGNFVVGRSSSD